MTSQSFGVLHSLVTNVKNSKIVTLLEKTCALNSPKFLKLQNLPNFYFAKFLLWLPLKTLKETKEHCNLKNKRICVHCEETLLIPKTFHAQFCSMVNVGNFNNTDFSVIRNTKYHYPLVINEHGAKIITIILLCMLLQSQLLKRC